MSVLLQLQGWLRVIAWLSASLIVATGLAACVNPNAIGVQDTGTITGTVVDATTLQPINNALVAVGNQVATTVSGRFTLNVPIGQQTLNINAGGYAPFSVNVMVTTGSTVPVDARLTPAS